MLIVFLSPIKTLVILQEAQLKLDIGYKQPTLASAEKV